MTDVAMWDTGQENVHKNRHKVTKEVEEETNPAGKWTCCQENGDRGVFSETGALGTNHNSSVSLGADTVPCLTGFANAVHNAVRCWNMQRD